MFEEYIYETKKNLSNWNFQIGAKDIKGCSSAYSDELYSHHYFNKNGIYTISLNILTFDWDLCSLYGA